VPEVIGSTTSEAPGDAASAAGSFENPLPGGEFGDVGDWRIRVVEVIPDAYGAIIEVDESADSPEPGNQFFMITLEAQYVGADSGNFWSDMGWKAVGPSAIAYEEGDSLCGFIPDPISDTNEVFPGGVVTGNLCWSVAEQDATGLILLLEQFFGDSDQRTAYALDPEMQPVEPLAAATADVTGVPATPIGEFAEVGDWNVRVVTVEPDAAAIVLDENEYADPPAAGHRFVMATIEAEYVGTDSGDFWSDLTWKALGPSSVAYTQSSAPCGTIPDDIYDFGEVFAGGSIIGNTCWSVTETDAEDLLMILEEFSMDKTGRTFYRLVGGE
jgi:hypothetical protein